MIMEIVGTMGAMGLTLALIGLYGLVAYSVGRRTREIGLRMAVGASQSDILRMVLRQGLVLSLAGIGVGGVARSEEHTSELQSHSDLVCRLLLEKKKKNTVTRYTMDSSKEITQ